MADEAKDTYGMESSSSTPASGADDAAAPPASAPRAGRPIEPAREPVGLEPDDDDRPMSQRSVRDLDVCPNCGANMPGGDTVVCLRCGFDLKTMKQVKTAVGQVEVGSRTAGEGAAGEGSALRKPIVIAGMGGTTVPLIAAAVAGAILALGYLAGIGGLFPPAVGPNDTLITNPEIAFSARLLGLFKLLISVGMWTGCGLGALVAVAYLNGLRLGDGRLAAARMLGVVTVMHLARFLSFKTPWIEWTLESIAMAAIFGGLTMVVFNLKPKDTPIMVGSAIVLFLAMWVSAMAIVWSAA